MKFLVAFSCLLAIAAAKPGYLAAPLVAPSGFSYSTVSAAPLAYSAHYAAPYAAYAAPAVAAAAYAAPAVAAAAPVAYAAAAPVVAAAPAVAKTQYHAQDELGQAAYGHTEAFQSHNAVQDAAGNKVGSYSYVAPNGQVFATNYVADALGYRVASNALPVGPNVVPVAPADTPEVVAARAAHLHEHAVARSRSRRSVALAAAPVAYSGFAAPYAAYPAAAVASPIAYAAAAPVVRAATLTTVVNTPGHAVSYRVD